MLTKHITIYKAIFTPEITKNNPQIIYLPGFSLNAKSKAVNYLGNYLAKNGFSTVAISTTPHILLENSLEQEAKEIADLLQKSAKDPFILVAHSKGASKAIAVLEQLKQKPAAVVLITPVGIYPQNPKILQKLFVKEVKENTIPHIKKELTKGHKPMLNLALGVLSMASKETIIFLKTYPLRLQQEIEDLTINAPKRAKKVLFNLTIPIIIGYTKNDKVVEADKLLKTIKQEKKNNIYVEELSKEVTHAIPYTHPEIVLKLINSAASKIK